MDPTESKPKIKIGPTEVSLIFGYALKEYCEYTGQLAGGKEPQLAFILRGLHQFLNSKGVDVQWEIDEKALIK